MSASRLEKLPAEICARICDYLDHDQALSTSLLSFALANKYCYSVASRVLFHTIYFKVIGPMQVLEDVQRLEGILQRDSAFHHVRRLIITGSGIEHDGDSSTTTRTCTQHHNWRLPKLASLEQIDEDSALMSYLCQKSDSWLLRPYRSRPKGVYDMDSAWLPLAELMKRLPGLRDVVYACARQVSPCLLETLHRDLPECRLHHLTFWLNGLNPKCKTTDANEMALASSPSLCSIYLLRLDVKGYDGSAIPVNHDNTVSDLVRDLAPNLAQVHIFRGNGQAKPLKKEMALLRDDTSLFTGAKASLKCLELQGRMGDYISNEVLLEKRVVVAWNSRTDFSNLRVLKLGYPVVQEALESLATDCAFPNLNTLVLTCYSRADIGTWARTTPPQPPPAEYYNTVKQFLHSLPKLSDLEILEWDGSVSLAPALGSKMRKLFLRTRCGMMFTRISASMSAENIAQLADHCPELEHLLLQVRRCRGDADEVATYRAIGRLRKLRHLNLTLDASPPPWISGPPTTPGGPPTKDTIVEPHFDDFDKIYAEHTGLRPYRNGHVRDILVNSAVDEFLARAIFEVVSSAQNTSHVTGHTSPLETLIVRSAGGMAFCLPGLHAPAGFGLGPLLVNLEQKWFLERDTRDDSRDIVHATELDQEVRESYNDRDSIGPGRYYLDIFRRIWPENHKDSDWRNDWRSWPLQTRMDAPRRSKRLQSRGAS